MEKFNSYYSKFSVRNRILRQQGYDIKKPRNMLILRGFLRAKRPKADKS